MYNISYIKVLQQGTNHKHLRLFFSNNGLWHDHTDYIVKKAYTRLNILRKVRFILNRFTLEKSVLLLLDPFWNMGMLFGIRRLTI